MFYEQVVAVVADGDLTVRVGDGGFEQTQGFAGNDERVGLGAFDIGTFVPNEPVRIRGDALHTFFIQLEENAGHSRAKIICARSEQGLVDGGDQRIGGGAKAGGVIGHRFFWEIIGVFTHHLVFTVVAGDLDTEVLIDVEGEGLIGQVLKRVDQDLGRDTNAAGFLASIST